MIASLLTLAICAATLAYLHQVRVESRRMHRALMTGLRGDLEKICDHQMQIVEGMEALNRNQIHIAEAVDTMGGKLAKQSQGFITHNYLQAPRRDG